MERDALSRFLTDARQPFTFLDQPGERLSEFWMDTNRPYYGDTVELPEGYRYESSGTCRGCRAAASSTRSPSVMRSG